MEPARFRIDANDSADPVIEVNGVDVAAQVTAAQVTIGAGQTVLTLVAKPAAGTIEGEGVVQITTPGTDAEIICEFLEQVDPELLDQDALNGHDVSQGLTPVILQVLASYAKGEAWDRI